MGYYTKFELELKTKVKIERTKQIVNRLNELIGFDAFECYIDEYATSDEEWFWDITSYDEMKWYDWQENMTTLAKEFPDVEFQLEGNGEDKDDWWVALFKGERKQIRYCLPPSNEWED